MEQAELEANLLLQAALGENDASAVKEALKKGANANYEGPDGGRPLHTASCSKGFLEIVNLLLKHGADVNVIDKGGFTPLMVAALNGRYEVVHLLLENGAYPNTTRKAIGENGQREDTGETALHLAMNSNSLATATELINAGADILARTTDDQSTPLHLAAEFGNMMSVKAILKHPCTSTDDLRARNSEGRTPSEVANNEELAHFIELWATPRSEIGKRMISALINSDLAELEEALSKGADPNLNIPRGARPLHTAAMKGAVPLVNSLLTHGAEVDAPDNEGYTPLMVASLNGHLDVAKQLLNYGADPKVKRPKEGSGEEGGEETALHMAVRSQSRTLVRTLLEHGADINAQCSKGNTALHYAAELKAYDVAEELLGHPDCKKAEMNVDYQTPSTLANNSNDTRFLSLFQNTENVKVDPQNLPMQRLSIYENDGSLTLRVVTGAVKLPSDDVYKNMTNPRGHVLIINYEKFVKLSERKGSSVDVLNLKNLFEQMGYQVQIEENLDLEKTREVLKKFRDNPDLKKADSLFVCMMSHGKDRSTFYTSDDKEITVNEVYDFFKDDACPSMRGKPKVFLFNFCRGELREKRSKGPKHILHCDFESNAVSTQEVSMDSKVISEEEHKAASTELNPIVAPRDQLSVFASTEGIMALRTDMGTDFIRVLCQIFAKYAHMYHLMELIGKISQHMENECSTTPATESVHFTKKLYLNPEPQK